MSFYVTLPSNSSMHYFPNNTCSNFVTKLKIPIQLEGSYEVALTEVTLPFNWSAIIDGGIIVRNSKTREIENIKVNWYIDQSINEIVEYLNNSMRGRKMPLVFTYNMQNCLFNLKIPNDYSVEFLGKTAIELGFEFVIAVGSSRKKISKHLSLYHLM
jgi:hypothetical protein